MWATRLISDDGLKATPGGYSLDIRLPWYRTLPVATLRDVTLLVDDRPVANDDIRVELNGKLYALGETDNEPGDVLWHMQDSGYLQVTAPPLAQGERHVVTLRLTVSIPYARNFVLTTECTKSLVAA